MAQVLVRNLDDDVHHKLRAMAQRHGESLEALVRDLLRRAVYEESREDQPLGTALAKRFAACGLEAAFDTLGQISMPPVSVRARPGGSTTGSYLASRFSLRAC